jgi:hypothetical protein
MNEQEKERYALRELHRWHITRFAGLGFDRPEAEALELAHVDWHEAEDLIRHGCPAETAIRILT